MAENVVKYYKRGAVKKNAGVKMRVAECGCSKDVDVVSCLPDEWVPKHSGPTLTKYLEEQEQTHNKLLEDFTSQCRAFNCKINDKVRELSEKLVAMIQKNKTDMDCAAVNLEPTGSPPFSHIKIRNHVLKQISQLYDQRMQYIEDYKASALQIESERAEGLRGLMRDQFQRLLGVGHQPAKNLLHNFDDHMYEINQQLLSNNIAYSELETGLKTEADDDVVKAKSAFNLACLRVPRGSRNTLQLSEIRKPLNRSVSLRSLNRTNVSEPIIDKYMYIQEAIDNCVSQLVEGYRQAVLKAFSGFSGQLTDLHNILSNYTGQTEPFCHSTYCTLETSVEGALKRISASFHKKISVIRSEDLYQMAENDVGDIENSLASLGDCLRDTYTILHDAGHLWDAHMMRSALAQKLTITAVEDLLTNHDVIEQASEVNFNLTIEQMRVAPDENNLKSLYESLLVLIKNTIDMYQQHSAAEVARLEKFMSLPPAMSEVLLAEFQCFLEKHPRVPMRSNRTSDIDTQSYGSGKAAINTPARDMYLRSALPRALLLTELQEIALMNWRNGFLEAFEYNVGFVPEELTHQGQQWVDERTAVLHSRFSLKQMSHSIRAERIKGVYENRLAQLRYHESRLKSHLSAIYNLIETLPKNVTVFLNVDSPELFPIQERLAQIDKDMKIMLANTKLNFEARKLRMTSYAPRLKKYREQFEQSLDDAVTEYHVQVEHRIQNARISNVRFVAHVKLFNEDGNYAVAEAQIAVAELVKVTGLLEDCVSHTNEALNHRRRDILSLVDNMIAPLRKKVEEYVKDPKTSEKKKEVIKKNTSLINKVGGNGRNPKKK